MVHESQIEGGVVGVELGTRDNDEEDREANMVEGDSDEGRENKEDWFGVKEDGEERNEEGEKSNDDSSNDMDSIGEGEKSNNEGEGEGDTREGVGDSSSVKQ